MKNFKPSTIFRLRHGTNEKTPGFLKFENGENPAKEFYAKVPKIYEEIFLTNNIQQKQKFKKKIQENC